MLKHVSSAICVAILAVAVLLFAPFRASADNAGTVEGVVKSSSGQPLSGAYVKAPRRGKAPDLHGHQPGARALHGEEPASGKIQRAGHRQWLSEQPEGDEVAAGKSAQGRFVAYRSAAGAARQRLAGQARKCGRGRNVGP